jgi:hypothetical protein
MGEDMANRLRRRPNSAVRVYFIRCNEFVKIGRAMDVQQRLTELQVGCPDKLELLATIEGGPKEERAFHKLFSDIHVRGEWFLLNDRLRHAITALTARDKAEKSWDWAIINRLYGRHSPVRPIA